jgi:hypothetical protein
VLYFWDIRFVLIALDSGLKTTVFCNDSPNIFKKQIESDVNKSVKFSIRKF